MGPLVELIFVFSETATAIEAIPLGNAPSGTMQGPRYTTLERVLNAKTVVEALEPQR